MRNGMWLLGLIAAVVATGCAKTAQKEEPVWTVQEVALVGQMAAPECVCVDPVSGVAYVSNMETEMQGYWIDDQAAFISRLRPGGRLESLRWKTSEPEAPLHSPKGMCIQDGILYVADNTRVVGYPTGAGSSGKERMGPAGRKLNDMASDGDAVYVSDMAAGKVYRMDATGVGEIKAPEGVNGIAFFQGRMFAVSWDLADVYELDPSGKNEPVRFGLSAHFQAPDGIEVLDDGTFVVSDMAANRIVAISPDRTTVQTLLEVKAPADIGLDRTRMLLYVPQAEENCVSVWKLRKK